MSTTRRAKWTPPPPPTPRILHLPRRTTRRKPPTRKPSSADCNLIFRRESPVMLDREISFSHNVTPTRKPNSGDYNPTFRRESPAMLDRERSIMHNVPPVVLLNSGRRERVDDEAEVEEKGESTSGGAAEERESERSSGGEDQEKWRFQAEMLRAECHLLRTEREVAVKKLENERCLFQRSLKSAVHTLLSGKKKISEGENVSSVLEEEIKDLSKKLVELQRRSSRLRSPESQKCSNFDKQASDLQKQLEEYKEMNQDEGRVEEAEELAGASLSFECTREGKIKVYGGSSIRSIRPADVETLRRKMERLSKGKLLKRMEEVYGSMMSATSYSVPSSASSSKRYDLTDVSSFSYQHSSQEPKSGELKACSGQCKAIVKRIMEQVKAETEQWSQMQEMLGQVREEMEDLQASRDFWEARALESDHQIQNLHSQVEEWKQKAVSSEIRENKLHKQVDDSQQEIERLRTRETSDSKVKPSKDSAPISLGAQLAKEKRVLLTCRVKERNRTNENNEKKAVDYTEEKRSVNRNSSSRLVSSSSRFPFKDIANVSPLARQNSRRYVYPLHNPKEF